ncbi:MAG TPA: type II toxin-antitoxin system VapC family toxin [Solirubrobacteraceae bacterium]|jgi:predicted nucleic acid-binding protein|nr:type II toxin-antitoxin system VapC family toxin [Solirubrobacteraceae bacterium]
MIVLDATATVEMLIDSSKGQEVQGWYMSEQSHAPELISYEVLSAIRGRVRGKHLSSDEALVAMLDFASVEENLELWPLLDHMTERAIQLRENVSAYDATYVALAQMMPCRLVTADARLGLAVDDLIDVIVV